MKVLVTGGAGFIGSHIVGLLIQENKHDVVVIDDLSTGCRANIPATVPLHVVDIATQADLVRQIIMDMRPDVICHQAAQLSVSRSVRDPVFDAQVNCIGLLNVLTAAADAKCPRIVFASSGGVLYGNTSVPAHEMTRLNPGSPYGITKVTGERYLAFFARQYGMTSVALRYSNVYGPRQNPHGEAGVVAIFAEKFLSDKPITINGDGKYVRDYVYGLDVARANVMAMTADLADSCLTSFNIGTGIGTDVNQLSYLISLAVRRYGKNAKSFMPKIAYGPERPGDLRTNMVDASFARRELDWTPKMDLMRGIDATVEWFARVYG